LQRFMEIHITINKILTSIQLIKQSSFNTNKRYDHSTSRYDHKHLLKQCRLLKVLSGGPTKASWPLFRQIHCFGLSASLELQSDHPW
jgi:hypothetical protein